MSLAHKPEEPIGVDDDSGVPIYQQVLQLLGPQAAEALATTFAGRRIYVPRSISGESHPLAAALGPVSAAKLVQALGGAHLDVPISVGRRAEILALSRLGIGPIEIQNRVKCSRSLVFKILREARAGEPSDQLDMGF